MSLTISVRQLGSRRPLLSDWSLALPPDDFGGGEGITLRDLISKIVATEVAGYAARREERRLDRVLTPQQIDDGARSGAIRPEAREVPPPPPVEEAVGTALLAFEDGLFIVAIDGAEVRELDAQVYPKADSRVTFIRLTFLAGA